MSESTTSQLPPLPRFQSAVRRLPVSAAQTETDNYYRYRDGRVPRAFMRFLLSHPDIARELLADIEAYHQEGEQAA